jgi:UDP-N-acetylglucosamine 1-carboxyvinyltransferase
MPPIFIRTGEVIIESVGGCDLGARNLDFHYRGFARLGATVTESAERIRIKGDRYIGTSVYLDIPSHTGTENLITAACFAEGRSIIENASMEPEIVDFANFLNKMGAKISGVGTGFIEVEGVEELRAVDYTVMPDRLDAGALAMAVAATGGKATLVGANVEHFGVVRHKLEQMGVDLEPAGAVLHVHSPETLRPINVVTWPYPGFATDLQSPIMALSCLADGKSYIRENIFENRLGLAEELKKLGADITIENTAAVITGPTQLTGSTVYAHDIRAGIALVIASLAAEGETRIENGYVIERGYSHLVERLSALGATIERHTDGEPVLA